MMGTWMPETCTEEKYIKQNCAPSWTYLQKKKTDDKCSWAGFHKQNRRIAQCQTF